MERPEAEQYLEALGEILEKEADEPVYMLICGGMAGILQDLLHRPTRDIDCAGFVVIEDGVPVLRKPLLAEPLRSAIRRVAAVYSMSHNWLSFQSRMLLDDDLPEGLVERAQAVEYGNKLTLWLISRTDLIFLKFKAAISRERQDVEDLVHIGTTQLEAEAAARWCFEQGATSEEVAGILKRISYGKVARGLV